MRYSMLLLLVRQLAHLPNLAREVDVHGMSMSKKHATVGGNCLDMHLSHADAWFSGGRNFSGACFGQYICCFVRDA